LAQACGEGTFTFEIYTLNGNKLENINYEILPFNIDSIKIYSHQPRFDLYRGEIINAGYATKLVDTSKVKVLDEHLAFRDNKKKGAVKDGIINFKTLELAYYPCMLHLFSNKKDIYILANLVGSCNRTAAVLWNEYPQLVSSY
jgi:hypothetical protein